MSLYSSRRSPSSRMVLILGTSTRFPSRSTRSLEEKRRPAVDLPDDERAQENDCVATSSAAPAVIYVQHPLDDAVPVQEEVVRVFYPDDGRRQVPELQTFHWGIFYLCKSTTR